MVVSVDFDGTCVTHEFPRIGKQIGAEIVLKALRDAGHDIICTTMRSLREKTRYGIDTVEEAKGWFNDEGIELYGFNDNPSQNKWTDSRKIYAHIYIDDQFIGTPLLYNETISNRVFVDWCGVTLLLKAKGFLSSKIADKVIMELVDEYPYIYWKHRKV